jgi:hypothetical protein
MSAQRLAGDALFFQTLQQFPMSGAPLGFHLPVAPGLFIGGGGLIADAHDVEIEIADLRFDPQSHVVITPIRLLDMRDAAFDKQGVAHRAGVV